MARLTALRKLQARLQEAEGVGATPRSQPQQLGQEAMGGGGRSRALRGTVDGHGDGVGSDGGGTHR